MNKKRGIDVSATIDRLKQGLISDVPTMVGDAHRELYGAAADATGLISEELLRIDLTQVKDPASTRLVLGLTALLHDLDENASAVFFGAVRTKRLQKHPALYAQRLSPHTVCRP